MSANNKQNILIFDVLKAKNIKSLIFKIAIFLLTFLIVHLITKCILIFTKLHNWTFLQNHPRLVHEIKLYNLCFRDCKQDVFHILCWRKNALEIGHTVVCWTTNYLRHKQLFLSDKFQIPMKQTYFFTKHTFHSFLMLSKQEFVLKMFTKSYSQNHIFYHKIKEFSLKQQNISF